MEKDLLELMQKDRKLALQNKNKELNEVIQLVLAGAKSLAKVELVNVENKHIVKALETELKQITEAYEMMKNNMSQERKEIYERKIKHIESYLPVPISEKEIRDDLCIVFADLGLPREMKSQGILMKAMLEKYKNDRVSKSLLSRLIKEFLTI